MSNNDLVICPCCLEECCEEDMTSFNGKPMCDLCKEGHIEDAAEQDDIDHWGYRDPSPEEDARNAFNDRLEMYRNEY